MNPVTVRKYSLRLRERIVKYVRQGFSISHTRRILLKKHYVKTSCKSLRNFIKHFQKTGSINPSRPNGNNVKLKNGHIQFINMWVSQNDEITAQQIVMKFKRVFNMDISKATVKSVRKKLGWTYKRASYCQLVSHPNKLCRMTICIDWWTKKEDFRNVIFVDETAVEMDKHGRFHFHRKGEVTIAAQTSKRPKPKHPYKVLVWGGISYKGRTGICVFKGIMDSLSYQEILRRHLIPFGTRMFPEGYRLYQDNDPKHNSKSTVAFYASNGVTVMKTPASSPDLNPIENVWGGMKDFLLRERKPVTKDELISGIREFWQTRVTPDLCARYINHIHKVIPKVILLDGEPTGY